MVGKAGRSAAAYGKKVGLEAGIGGIEQLTARDDHDVDALPARDGIAPEDLSYQSFGPITCDGAAEFPRRHDSQARLRGAARRHQNREIPAVNAGSFVEDLLELAAPSDPAGLRKALSHDGRLLIRHTWSRRPQPVFRPAAYSDDTVSRLRPFARRRLSTRRPFFVLMRTRKP
jgi:hypothetical protein